MGRIDPDVVSDWNANALARHQQIASGIDLSYEKVLVPTILELADDIQHKTVIDVGCGDGDLASKLAKTAAKVIGVDASVDMIQIARRQRARINNLEFINAPLEEYVKRSGGKVFDIAVSNMTLMTVPHVDQMVDAIGTLLKQGGILIATITHPWFWNQYKRFEETSDFDYLNQHIQRGPFFISLDKEPLPAETTVFHRPLQAYFEAFFANGLYVERLLEPFPSPDVEKLYPESWKFPRFLAFKCRNLGRPAVKGN